MIIKPEPVAAAATKASPATACGNCGVEDRLLIHQVRHRGIFRRLCTTCVLRLHPQAFCPTCFQVYPPPPSNDAGLTCVKCYSSSHSHCVAAGPMSPPSPYICPLCVSPNSPIFKLKIAKEANIEIGEGCTVKNEECRVMDRDAAKKLQAAAKIASSSMNKAAVAAKAEAERRAKEAAITRKRAKEALEHVAYLVMKEKLRKKEAALAGSGEVAAVGGVAGNVGYAGGGFNTAKVKRENNVNVGSNANGIVGSCVGPSVLVEEKIDAVGNADRVDNSNQVLPALNAVELRENKKTSGITAQGVILSDEKDKTMANAGENVAERNGGSDSHPEMFSDMETGAGDLNMQGAKQDDANSEVLSVQTVADRMDCNDGEQHVKSDAL